MALAALLLAVAASLLALPGGSPLDPASKDASTVAAEDYGKLPLTFVPNRGQTNPEARFQAQAGGASFFFTKEKAVIALAKEKRGHALELRFLGSNPSASIEARRPALGRVSYLVGPSANHKADLPTYGELVYHELWPGIDMVFRGARGLLKYEFIVHPGANPNDIQLAWNGSSGLSLNEAGQLLVATPLGSLTDAKPRSYQRAGGRRTPVESRFDLGRRTGSSPAYGFALGSYDRRAPLVIDPGLIYSTYLGGANDDFGSSIAVDGSGNAYIAGRTDSTNYPTVAGSYDTGSNGAFDVFVTKLGPAGAAALYSTYLGGAFDDEAFGIAVDGSGSAYVTGGTDSTNFPTSGGALDTSANGGFDVFVTKLNSAGTALSYSTYLGGASHDEAFGIAVDGSGGAYVTGHTNSNPFPTSGGAFDTAWNGGFDAFVTKLNSTGTALSFSSYLGGAFDEAGFGVAVDGSGNAYVAGSTSSNPFPTTLGAFDTFPSGAEDAFVSKFNSTGAALTYSTYLGGSASDEAYGIDVDGSGSAYVTGQSFSTNFPTSAGALDTTANGEVDAFATKLNTGGTGLTYSTYLGGSLDDQGFGIAVDSQGTAYLTGGTGSTNFPTTAGAHDTSANGLADAFVTALNITGSALSYSTYLGGASDDFSQGIAEGGVGQAYIAGYTFSNPFPTTAGAFNTSANGSYDAFAAKFDIPTTGTIVIVKDAVPNDAQDFSFTAGGGLSPTSFSLDDDADGTLSNTKFYTNYPAGSGYSVSESVPTGWSQASATCSDGSPVSNINLSPGETVTCTFTNEKRGQIVVVKNAVPDDAQDFNFTAGGGLSPSSFQLDDDTNGTLSNTQTFANVVPGSGYSVSESTPAGWVQKSATCSDGSPVSNISVSIAETVTCTFLNERGYPRPTGGNTVRAPLVPAMAECTQGASNSTHGGNLQSDAACNNPQRRTSSASLGTSAAAGTRVGYADIAVCNLPQPPTGVCSAGVAGTLPDVRLRGNASDIVCTPPAPTPECLIPGTSDYDPNTTTGPYTSNLGEGTDSNAAVPQPTCKPTPPNPSACAAGADMTATAVIPGSSAGGQNRAIRITDSYNSLVSVGDPAGCGATTSCSATVEDQAFGVPVVCQATPSTTIGSYCGVNTTANALVPGVVEVGKQAVVQLGQIQVFDSGPDDIRGNGDDQPFAVQGIFIP